MAKDKKQDKAKPDAAGGDAPKKSSLLSVIVTVVLLTLIAGGGGFAFGSLLLQPKAPDHATDKPAKTTAEGEAKPEGEAKAAEAGPEPGHIVRQLSPIITNLQSPKDSWIRLEMSVVLKPEAASEQDLIAVRAGDRVLGLLRTVSLSQIDGPSGLLHLREDLTDLLVEGHDSEITQVLINSMVVE